MQTKQEFAQEEKDLVMKLHNDFIRLITLHPKHPVLNDFDKVSPPIHATQFIKKSQGKYYISGIKKQLVREADQTLLE